jgi:hypothetical protein
MNKWIDWNQERIRRLHIYLSVFLVVFAACAIYTLQAQGSEPEILFLSNRSGNVDVYTMQSDGSNVQLFLSGSSLGQTGYINSADLSPDGSVLAVAYAVPDSSGFLLREIYLVNVADGAVTQLTNDGRDNWNPVWSPDGSSLAILQGQYGDAYIVNPLTGEKQLLFGTQNILASIDELGGYVSALDWTSNQQLVLSLDIGGPVGYDSLYLINSDGSGVLRILPENRNGYYPIWQPGSNLIYYICSGERAICSLNPGTSIISQITNLGVSISPNILITQIDVTSTGFIVIAASEITFSGGVRDIYTFDPQTNNLENITPDNQDISDTAPRWISDITLPLSPTEWLIPTPTTAGTSAETTTLIHTSKLISSTASDAIAWFPSA